MTKIVSGGQTGADRAALDFAIAHGLPHGGWCPTGRVAEDGPIVLKYQLMETPSTDSAQRTEWNVRDSDGTVIFSISPELRGGSELTAKFAGAYLKPCLHLSLEAHGDAAPELLRAFLNKHQLRVLNVAGSRLSEERGIELFTRQTLLAALVNRP
ncbi:MAG: hypothetical protein C5B50_24340 [Verrucomicrobia bacterium]|nr:MAG: hypothetical protein C5B50_24340 [Verrucomicrobiota bacterium]